MRIKSNTVYCWQEEDLPYFDLTTQVLGVAEQSARMTTYFGKPTGVGVRFHHL